MKYTALWGSKGFLVTPTKIAPITSFGTTLALKSESSDDANGTAKSNVRGRELQKVTLSTIYVRAAGVTVRTQIEEWDDLLGKAYPLYISGKRFGPYKLMLTNVEVSDVLLSNTGTFLKATVSLTFEEYDDGKKTSLRKNMTIGKTQATSATASKSDKNSKKT